MAANCEKLQVTVTGTDCLDILSALDYWVKHGLKKECSEDIQALRQKIYAQYNNNPRLPVEEN